VLASAVPGDADTCNNAKPEIIGKQQSKNFRKTQKRQLTENEKSVLNPKYKKNRGSVSVYI